MPVIASVGLGAIQTGVGAYQAIQANKKLKELESQPLASLAVSPELQQAYQRSLKMAEMGFTPEQSAAYHSNVGTQQNTAYRNATDRSGGNLSQAINAGLQSQNIMAENQFASEDADKRMRNIQYADNLARQIQDQRNIESQANRQYRMNQEQQYGLAQKTGIENVLGGVGTAVTGGVGGMQQN